MSIVLYEDCEICKSTSVAQINDDLRMKVSYPLLCERNNLPYSIQTINELVKHHKDHIQDISVALARHMLHEEAIQMKNTAIEANLAIDQIDIMLVDTYRDLEKTDDPKTKTLIRKNFIDLQDKKLKALAFHHRISGKELIEDLKRASLTETVKAVGKELGDEAVKKIQKDSKKRRSIKEFLMDDEYMNLLYENHEDDGEDYEIKG